MITIVVLGVIGAVGLVSWIAAHTKGFSDPSAFTPELRPIHRLFTTRSEDPVALLVRAVTGVRGAVVVQRCEGVLFVDVRPSAGRLDDGLGLHVRLTVAREPSGWSAVFDGARKVRTATVSTSQRALASFERQVRQQLAQGGIRAADGLGDAFEVSSPAPTSIAVSLKSGSLGLRASDGNTTPLDRATLVGRDPAPRPTDGNLALVALAHQSVSKTHCCLTPTADGLVVEDRNSTNGTAVRHSGGEFARLTPGATGHVIAGSTLRLGEVILDIVDLSEEGVSWAQSSAS